MKQNNKIWSSPIYSALGHYVRRTCCESQRKLHTNAVNITTVVCDAARFFMRTHFSIWFGVCGAHAAVRLILHHILEVHWKRISFGKHLSHRVMHAWWTVVSNPIPIDAMTHHDHHHHRHHPWHQSHIFICRQWKMVKGNWNDASIIRAFYQ